MSAIVGPPDDPKYGHVNITDTDDDTAEFTIYGHNTIVVRVGATMVAINDDDLKDLLQEIARVRGVV